MDRRFKCRELTFQHSTHLVPPKGKKLRKGIIDIKALTAINNSTHNEGPLVSSLQFHPTSTVAFVAGESGILSLFQVIITRNVDIPIFFSYNSDKTRE